MNLYHMNEADIILPEQMQDQSAHVFSYTVPDSFSVQSTALDTPPEFSLIITRDTVRAEVTLSNYVNQQTPELERNLKGFKIIERRDAFVDGVNVLMTEFTWQSEDGMMRQRQASLFAPLVTLTSTGASARVALTLTATSRESAQAKYAFLFEQILYSFSFRRT